MRKSDHHVWVCAGILAIRELLALVVYSVVRTDGDRRRVWASVGEVLGGLITAEADAVVQSVMVAVHYVSQLLLVHILQPTPLLLPAINQVLTKEIYVDVIFVVLLK